MSHMKNLRMFQLSDVPPKLDSWQDYFVQTKQGEDLFPVFLHYYEPVLNEIANSFCRKYGLDNHFADMKMVYVEAMLTELEHYDLACAIPFLQLTHRKLTNAMHTYAMFNLRGFSETSLTHYARLRKAAYPLFQYFDVRKTLQTRQGICFDFSHLFAAFCRSQGIPCYAVDGISRKNNADRHTWNRVYYDGTWWNVDITTDNSRTANGKELYGFHKLEGAFVPDEDFFITKIY